MACLYELVGEWKTLNDMAEGGELDAEVLADTLEGIDGEIEIKLENYARVAKNLDARAALISKEAEIFKAEYERLKALSEGVMNNKKRLLEHAGVQLEQMVKIGMLQKPSFKTEHFTIYRKKNAPKLIKAENLSVTDVPEEYTKVEKSINDKAIKDALLEGKELEFAHLETTILTQVR